MPRLPHPRTALSGYADARLPLWRRAVVDHHLRGCTRCALEVAQIQALRDLLRTSPPVPEAPPALVDRLLALGGEAGDGDARPAAEALPADPATAHLLSADEHARAGVGAAGVLVAAVLLTGTVAAGATVTGVAVPWPSASARASMTSVLPRLWSGPTAPDGAASVRPVDNGQRP